MPYAWIAGWTVFQRRADGTEEFFSRTWNDYKVGFGTLTNEFWLGNDKLHRITQRRNMMVRFDLEDYAGKKAYAQYESFFVESEKTRYKVHAGKYSGNAGDSFKRHNGMPFSTREMGGCAATYGAWWYESCHYSNLNGMYLKGDHKSYANGVNWYHFKGYHHSMKRTEIKVTPK